MTCGSCRENEPDIFQYSQIQIFGQDFYGSSRNTRDLSHEIRAQSETRLHREYNLTMKNKSLSYTMLHWSIVTHAYARRGKNAKAFLKVQLYK